MKNINDSIAELSTEIAARQTINAETIRFLIFEHLGVFFDEREKLLKLGLELDRKLADLLGGPYIPGPRSVPAEKIEGLEKSQSSLCSLLFARLAKGDTVTFGDLPCGSVYSLPDSDREYVKMPTCVYIVDIERGGRIISYSIVNLPHVLPNDTTPVIVKDVYPTKE